MKEGELELIQTTIKKFCSPPEESTYQYPVANSYRVSDISIFKVSK
jgi:hypothetical protein